MSAWQIDPEQLMRNSPVLAHVMHMQGPIFQLDEKNKGDAKPELRPLRLVDQIKFQLNT